MSEPTATLPDKLNKLPDMRIGDLHKGDVLLSRGLCHPDERICTADVIVKLDGGDYSHAAFFDGKHFVQATTEGVKADPPLLQTEHLSFMHVYRFHDAEGNLLDSDKLPSAPVIEASHKLIGLPYAYDELMLLGSLVLLRQFPGPTLMKDILEIFGGATLSKLREWLRKHILRRKENAIMCSEVIAECFWQSSNSKGSPYGLSIKITDRHRLNISKPNEAEHTAYQRLRTELESVISQASPQLIMEIGGHQHHQEQVLSGVIGDRFIKAGGPFLPSNCVSPCDLQRSPNLKLIGNYVDTDA